MSVLGERETRAASPPPRPSPRVWAWWGGDIGVMAIRSSGGGGGVPTGRGHADLACRQVALKRQASLDQSLLSVNPSASVGGRVRDSHDLGKL